MKHPKFDINKIYTKSDARCNGSASGNLLYFYFVSETLSKPSFDGEQILLDEILSRIYSVNNTMTNSMTSQDLTDFKTTVADIVNHNIKLYEIRADFYGIMLSEREVLHDPSLNNYYEYSYRAKDKLSTAIDSYLALRNSVVFSHECTSHSSRLFHMTRDVSEFVINPFLMGQSAHKSGTKRNIDDLSHDVPKCKL